MAESRIGWHGVCHYWMWHCNNDGGRMPDREDAGTAEYDTCDDDGGDDEA